jgi:type II secretory pathway pseudopilin PulG
MNLWRLGGRNGFSFLEVLFAIIILGVGFIMLAGLFPAAISQTQSNVAEATGAALGRDALRDLQSAVNNYLAPPTTGTAMSMLPPTNNPNSTGVYLPLPVTTFPVMPLPNELITIGGVNYAQSSILTPYTALPTANPYNLANPAILTATGNTVQASDPRFGWIGFYRRDWNFPTINGAVTPVPSPYAQVWIITAQSTAEGQPPYSTGPGAGSANIITGTAFIIETKIPNTSPQAYTYNSYLALPTSGTAFGAPSPNGTPIAPNCFALILSGDSTLVGQVVRLGGIYGSNTSTNTTYWNLLPGSDLPATDSSILLPTTAISGATPAMALAGGETVTVFILGSPNGLAPAQDLTCSSGFIRLSN